MSPAGLWEAFWAHGAGRAAHPAPSNINPCVSAAGMSCLPFADFLLRFSSCCSERQEAEYYAWRVWLLCVLSRQICPPLPGVDTYHVPSPPQHPAAAGRAQYQGPVQSCMVPIVTQPGNRSQGLRGERRLAL